MKKLPLFFRFALSLGPAVGVSSADDLVWISTSSSDWNTPANWSPNDVPNSATDRAVFDGTAGTVNNLTFGSGAVPALNGLLMTSDHTSALSIDASANAQFRLAVNSVIYIDPDAGPFSLGTSGSNITLVPNNAGSYTFQNESSNVATLGNKITSTTGGGNAIFNLIFSGSGNWQVDGLINPGSGSNPSSLTKNGAGTTTLAGANTYSGVTRVNEGRLVLDYTTPTTVLGVTPLQLGGGEVAFENLGAKNQNFPSTTIATGDTNKLTRGANYTSGVVSLGAIALTGGRMEVSSLTNAPGWIKVTNNLSSAALLGGAVTTNGGANLVATDANGFLIQGDALTDWSRGAAATGGGAMRLIETGTGPDTPGAPVTLAATGTTDISSLVNAYTAAVASPDTAITLDVGATKTLRLGSAGSLTSTLGTDLEITGGTLTAGGADNIAGTLSVNAGNAISVDSAIVDNGTGQVALTKLGGGLLTLWGTNSYTGATSILAGRLMLTGSATTSSVGVGTNLFSIHGVDALPAGTPITATTGTVVLGDGQTTAANLTFNGTSRGSLFPGNGSDWAGTITIDASSSNGVNLVLGATATISGNIVNNGGGVGFVVRNDSGNQAAHGASGGSASHLTIAGVVSGTGKLQAGVGSVRSTVVLTGANTFTGGMTVQNGASQMVVEGDGLLGAVSPGVGSYAGAVSLVNAGDLYKISSTATQTLSGVISGFGKFAKDNSGTVMLTAANTYAGGTTVTAGTLLADNTTGSATGTGTVTVQAAGTFGGTGALSGAVVLQPGGTLSPGSGGIESLATGALTVPDGATLTAQVDSSGTPAADVVTVTGDVTLGGTLTVTDIAGTAVAIPSGTKLTLLEYSGTLTGSFAGLDENDLISVGPNTFKIRYADGNKVTLEATTGGGDPYETWSSGHGLVGEAAGPDQDPDFDGLSNLIEFYLGGNPTLIDAAKRPVATEDGSDLVFTFERSDESEDGILSQQVQYGSDLSGWTTVDITAASSGPDANNVTVGVAENAGLADTVTVEIPKALAVAGKLFVRLVVTK